MGEPYRIAGRITKNGDTLAVTIPLSTREAMGLTVGDLVSITIEKVEAPSREPADRRQ